jgi:hypothetical protein
VKTYAIALCGTIDELLVAVVSSEEDARRFIADNPPRPVDGLNAAQSGPLAHAMDVRGCGPSLVLGYVVTEVVDGVPQRSATVRWGDTDENGVFHEEKPFDPTEPLAWQ